ncbi:2-dehydro-3-deoxygalactonokinase [Geosporobacter ferrireducens]|uniref:2-dehydro-3-deoxygalactonokinase n=1 Tax=Geosporobacter ferrireducens TaxID=1424294 RepID=A0A1D8GMK2_9FIRM|nr:2-dehydro-3-deoxygalactonokinase [Geosporobacter ferrireducens]AOT72125.1 hypothetical protein Gferi_22845 [Geosporobacter ferrireducens]MTI56013.1 hypothetical protein [Geosporobacter ferrireducens]
MLAVTVDVGTTNSRIRVIEDGEILSMVKSEVGIKDVAITGSKEILESALSKIIYQGLLNAKREIDEVEFFVASGMITSNLGLVEIPHRISPVSMDDLTKGIVKKEFEWIKNIPFYFIPGVKNGVEVPCMDRLDQIDVMRGEEVEAFGIMELCKIEGPALMILPGSHTKFVYIGKKNEIEKCSTTMLGEFLHALSKSTILSNSIPSNLVSNVDEEYVVRGIDFERKNGVTKAAFAARLMDISMNTTPNQRANFLAGALVSNDIGPKIMLDINEGGYKQIIIGGSSPLKDIFKIVLENKGLKNTTITLLTDDITDRASSVGSLKIVEGMRKAECVLV